MTYLPEMERIWTKVKEALHDAVTDNVFDLWFRDLKLVAFENDTVTLTTDTPFKHSFINEKYMGLLSEGFEKQLGFPLKICVSLADPNLEGKAPAIPEMAGRTAPEGKVGTLEFPSGVYTVTTDAERGEPAISGFPSDYSFEYTFSNFIVGSSNKFAHAACVAVADQPAKSYNPLFIYGDSGLGKTHLMYAVVNEIRRKQPDARIVYIKGDEFTNQLIDSLSRQRMAEFRALYRRCDVLLIDDIQFIAGKTATQEEFFHTFNALYEEHKQIILTSDRPPREIKTLEDRLKTRFEWGLIADIQPPDLELRTAILKKKAQQVNVSISDDVLYFLAENLRSNIRQIEGAIKKLGALSFISGEAVSMSTARSCIAELLGGAEPVDVTVDRILSLVSKRYNVKREDLLGKGRTKEVAFARHVSIYLMLTVAGLSQPQVGRYFNRDHTTVLASRNTVEKKLHTDPVFAVEIDELKKEVGNV